MSVIAAGLARADTNGRQKPSGPVLVELDGKASLVIVSQRSTGQPFERGRSGLGGQQPRRPLGEGGVQTDLAATTFISVSVNPADEGPGGSARLASAAAWRRMRANS
jgi:hypothetical protein